MEPVVLRSDRLVLDQPVVADIDRVAEYCRDPLFERFMTTPWPYTRDHAEGFLSEYVPNGWSTGREATWALRATDEGPLLGVIGIRLQRTDIGYWLGTPHRGSSPTTGVSAGGQTRRPASLCITQAASSAQDIFPRRFRGAQARARPRSHRVAEYPRRHGVDLESDRRNVLRGR
ncbi:GNAT family N-acetyltransferase [Luethyella okanaganae]|uniref:GNAT family N-acetyltransferase n=1 Tax=Luethyella okanaganae TaxID=69372 RepID=A0ABW1VB13_9MICO